MSSLGPSGPAVLPGAALAGSATGLGLAALTFGLFSCMDAIV